MSPEQAVALKIMVLHNDGLLLQHELTRNAASIIKNAGAFTQMVNGKGTFPADGPIKVANGDSSEGKVFVYTGEMSLNGYIKTKVRENLISELDSVIKTKYKLKEAV